MADTDQTSSKQRNHDRARLARRLGLAADEPPSGNADDRTSDDAEATQLLRRFAECEDRHFAAIPSIIADHDLGVDLLAQRDGPALWNRFEIVRLLGEGGFGVVFQAFDTTLQREVALKLPKSEHLWSGAHRSRFLREARIAAALNHAGIVKVYEVGEEEPIWYIASELCAGPSLAQWMRSSRQPIAPKQAAELLAQVADAVDHAHQHGVLHRDLKPSNILLRSGADDGRPSLVLTDFGLASRTEHDEDAERGVRGTFDYMAPEALGVLPESVTTRSDLFSLGVILYELLVGEPPLGHNDSSSLDAARERASRPLPHLPARRPDVPRDLAAICDKCLAAEPTGRYATAKELANDLRRFLQGMPVAARPVGPALRLGSWCRRRPVVAGLAAACLVSVICGVWGVVREWDRAEANLAIAHQQTSIAAQHLRRAQDSLVLLGWALDESFFWNDSPYQFDTDFRQSLANEFEPLIDQEQQFPPTQAVLATAHRRLAHELTERGDRDAGDHHHRQSLSAWRDLLRGDPANQKYRRSAVLTLYYWTQYRAQAGSPQAQVDDLVSGKLLEHFSLRDSVDRLIAADYAELVARRGEALRRIAAFPSSLGTLEAAADLYGKLRAAWPSDRLLVDRAAETYLAMGECYERIGKLRVAEFNYVAARRCWEELVVETTDASKHHDRLAAVQETIGRLRLRLGDLAGGTRALEAAMRIYSEQAGDGPLATKKLRQAADLAWEAASAGYEGWSTADQLTTWRRCKHLYESLGPDALGDRTVVQRLAVICHRQAEVELALEQHSAARENLRQSVAHRESLHIISKPNKADLLEYADALQKLADLQAREHETAAVKATYARLVQTYEILEGLESDYLVIANRLEAAREKLASL